jgi:3-deoxy-7-phosphoheptulonate synthase
MSFEYLVKVPTALEIINEMPLTKELKSVKAKRDKAILDIFKRKSSKFIVIIGPCSADNEKAVCEYVSRLAKLQSAVKSQLVLIPRIYTNKPRTTGEGYKGMAHQPDPHEKPNIVQGLKAIRRMHLRVLKETGLTAADEMLYSENYPYLEDVLSYVAIGARSVEDQLHRLTVSGVDIPCGMKNPTSGDLNVMLNSVRAAQMSHTFVYNGWEARTSGNSFAHCILRGAVNQYGQSIPNYHYEDMMRLSGMYLERSLLNPTIIVDASHANSNKNFKDQPRIAKDILYSVKNSDILKKLVKGIMIESYLVEGSQSVTGKVFGRSITDACLGWKDSEKLVLELADRVSKL